MKSNNRKSNQKENPALGKKNPRKKSTNKTNPLNKKYEVHSKNPGSRKKVQGSFSKKQIVIKPEKYSEEMRLNRFIANAGVCSRREADKYISGRSGNH